MSLDRKYSWARVHVRLSRKCARKDRFLVIHPESVGGDHRHWLLVALAEGAGVLQA
jgi:hypothetical protein